ncbi:DNA cytosine methyltransferase [Candidatus Pacearchaeota archaeon]|nr:DNA cytosine methyltransferase [Candidatus Pacearchaeota archaeon]
MKVLIACEFSGIVRDAFINQGHDAISCDLLPTENTGAHYQGDVFDIINDGFDLMIAHPPCTFLSYAGIAHWDKPGRAEKREEAMKFFMALYNADIPKIAIENPVGYPNTIFRKPDQIVKPYYFGESEQKNICLWTRGLNPLIHMKESDWFAEKTHVDKPNPTYIDKSGKPRYFTDAISGCGKNAKKDRSRFFIGIAEAMANQWGKL